MVSSDIEWASPVMSWDSLHKFGSGNSGKVLLFLKRWYMQMIFSK